MARTLKSRLFFTFVIAVTGVSCAPSRQALTRQAARAASELIYPSCGNIDFNTSIPALNKSNDAQIYNVSMVTNDSHDQIVDYYRNFNEDGWECFNQAREWVGEDSATVLMLSKEQLCAFIYVLGKEGLRSTAILILFGGLGK